ncbi:MAG: hypothetical protein ACTHXC_00305 [Brachybacterium sp.]
MDITEQCTPKALDSIMEFDHVIRVNEDGSVHDDLELFAPDLHDIEGGAWEISAREPWRLVHGKSNQQGYSGPLMHASEYIGERWAREILSEPGYYVAVVAYPIDDGEPESWALAHLPLNYKEKN